MCRSLSFVFYVVFFISCAQEKSAPVLAENLQGKWIIKEATRNNRETKLLNKGYFEISDSTFKTNLLKDEVAYPYSYSGKILKVKDKNSSAYIVKSLTSDTLIIWTKIKKFEFKITTVKYKYD